MDLTTKTKFMLSVDSNEKCTMKRTKSDSNIGMIGNDTNKIIQEFFIQS